jgi:hypothetical protein
MGDASTLLLAAEVGEFFFWRLCLSLGPTLARSSLVFEFFMCPYAARFERREGLREAAMSCACSSDAAGLLISPYCLSGRLFY